MKKIVFFFSFLLCILSISAQKVDTISVFSPKMEKRIKNVVILPDGYESSDKEYPVLYLLHGHGGRYDSWIKTTKKNLPEEATKWQMIIVCPDGQNSWYWDSPIDPKFQFETYVSTELVEFVDSNYKTIAAPEGRAITGFSMGGHGGLWLGMNHPEVFGACGSMSGGVDIRPFPDNWNMKDRLGELKRNEEAWNKHTVITLLDRINLDSPSIIIDCGTEDFFFQVNEDLHMKLLEKKIPHDYIVRPGAHNHNYWRDAVDYQILYFYNFFNKK